ncbi:unnamed protein product, partial [marine sediment metagenome]
MHTSMDLKTGFVLRPHAEADTAEIVLEIVETGGESSVWIYMPHAVALELASK